ncbi:MAG TPA: M90 family metallopeptidase [Kofleriaceae bacterium]|nr:M90 family metallopeptidase [Kofleriaceae bacterium]
MFGWLRERRRRRVLAEPFPEAWDRIIDENVGLARRLDPARRQRLRERVQVFIAETSWEGCGGLALTEEMQVTIAAQACLLLLDHADGGDELFRDVSSILVYPSTVVTRPRPLGFFEQPRAPVGHGRALIGEAILRGPVVLAWDAVQAGGREEVPGNVVLHELAHKLDMASGHIDGSPPLRGRAARERWARVCAAAYERHRAATAFGWPTAMDAYGATNEAEFFAVATETFFTRPGELAADQPELFALLADFYHPGPRHRS